MRGMRPMLSTLLLALIAIILLNALAGSSTSPVEHLLGIHHVPRWWPFALAGALGLAFGAVVRRPSGPQGERTPSSSSRSGAAAKPATRGRYAVPRHVRRERERDARRASRTAARQEAVRQPDPPAPVAEVAAPASKRRWPWQRGS